jgi:hypothetical protein
MYGTEIEALHTRTSPYLPYGALCDQPHRQQLCVPLGYSIGTEAPWLDGPLSWLSNACLRTNWHIGS